MARGRSLLVLGLLLASAAVVAALGQHFGRGPSGFHATAKPLVAAAIAAVLVYGLFFALERGLRSRRPDAARSLVHLQTIATALVAILAIGAVMGGFQSAVVSLGLVGFGLTLALQRPILAVAGWATLVTASTVRVGDRIRVGDLEGDVLSISLFTTRLWEVGEPGSATPDRPTGRTVTISNAVFLEKAIANATSDTPVVFDEFVVNVAFEADLELARDLLRRAGEEVLDMQHHATMARHYRRLTSGLSMEADFPRQPSILAESRPSWMEYRLRYLVNARRAGRTQAALTDAWTRLSAQHADRLPQVYPRNQPQAIGPAGRPRA